MKKEIPIDYLMDCVSYDAKSGTLRWKERPREHFKTHRGYKQTNARQTGKPAFSCPHSCGYLHGAINGMKLFAHRVIWAMHYGSWPDGEIDHINHNKTDNKIVNLRVADRLTNGKNLSRKSNNKTGVNGVYVHIKTQRFIAQIRVNHKMHHIGSFATMNDAATARKKAEEQHGFHQNHGI